MKNKLSPSVSRQSMVNQASAVSSEECQYMLNLLTWAEQALEVNTERFEQMVTAYLTVVTAIGGGIVLLMTSGLSGSLTSALTGLLLFLLAGFGTGVYLRMCSSKYGISMAYAHHVGYSRYFRMMFPNAAPYALSLTPEEELTVWQAMGFTPLSVSLLTLLAVLHSAAFGLGTFLIVSHSKELFGLTIGFPVAVVSALVALAVILLISLTALRAFRRKTKQGVTELLGIKEPDARTTTRDQGK